MSPKNTFGKRHHEGEIRPIHEHRLGLMDCAYQRPLRACQYGHPYRHIATTIFPSNSSLDGHPQGWSAKVLGHRPYRGVNRADAEWRGLIGTAKTGNARAYTNCNKQNGTESTATPIKVLDGLAMSRMFVFCLMTLQAFSFPPDRKIS